MNSLSILHVLRAPLGGLFRHVTDLAAGQIARGHRVGLVVDRLTLSSHADSLLRKLEPSLANGLTFVSVERSLGLRDIVSAWQITRFVRRLAPDVVHGHGAKGGAFARLVPAGKPVVRAYTPHGGTLLLSNEKRSTAYYLAIEKLMASRGNLYIFESEYSARQFDQKIARPRTLSRIVYNGLDTAEFDPIVAVSQATDLLFVGELRPVKGISVLLEAMSLLRDRGSPLSLTLVGSGPEREVLEADICKRGLSSLVRFAGAMNVRAAMALGRMMVIPSLAESFPYVVLEAAAAGIPLVATRVGGVPEIFGPLSDELVAPAEPDALASAIHRKLANSALAKQTADQLRARVFKLFSKDVMVDSVLQAYRDASHVASTSYFDRVQWGSRSATLRRES